MDDNESGVKKKGTRTYRNYTQETLKNALGSIRRKELSLQEAADLYKIPRRILWTKLHNSFIFNS
ncbi:unnamed protein product [Acanthoscelides obtectus]|uniref:HTH psq-type domain-containing protein n=1 Tax=Acanthoscelides obtectus TaxID=200917 RepID=A0A9P0JY49_ACAOB|nr:unnamed protein product [Acanthoscelides obtectus]CAK1646148.1 hypothetical protein AOBTE_LOCUS14479 [Acanthoscelides obtectus]